MRIWRATRYFWGFLAFNLAALVIASFSPLVARGQEGAGPAARQESSSSGRPTPPDQNTPRELIYSYYCVRRGWESRLELMDRAPRPIDFTLAVHGLSGRTVEMKPMTISPDAPVEIELRDSLNELGADVEGDFAEGSLSVHFKGPGNPLGGRLLVEGPNERWNLGPIWSQNESGYSMIPPRLETLWWDLGGSRDVVLTVNNTSSAPATADFFLDWAGKRHAAPALSFAPHQTRILSVTETLGNLGATAYQAPLGGLSIVPRDGRAVLVAQAKLTDAETNKVIGLVFYSPQHQVASALDAIAVPISVPAPGSLYAGLGSFTPHLVVRNLLEGVQTLTLTVVYPGKNAPALTPLGAIHLAGYTTEDIRLDNYYTSLPLPLPYCQLRVQYSGPPGTLEAELRVVEENSGAEEEIPIANEGDGYAGSLASYWSFDDRHDDYVFFTDLADEPGRFAMRIDAGGVSYSVPIITLQPHETRFVNLRELVALQQPDARGHLIPKDVTEGRLIFNRMDNVAMYGRILEVERPARLP